VPASFCVERDILFTSALLSSVEASTCFFFFFSFTLRVSLEPHPPLSVVDTTSVSPPHSSGTRMPFFVRLFLPSRHHRRDGAFFRCTHPARKILFFLPPSGPAQNNGLPLIFFRTETGTPPLFSNLARLITSSELTLKARTNLLFPFPR